MRNWLRLSALYAFHIGFVRPVLRWIAAVRYRRRGLVPKGPCLVVANHNSHLDAALLMGLFSLKRLPHVHPVAAADYFGKTRFLRFMAMLLMNAIPIERRPRSGDDPLSRVADELRRGESLIFFPEGSRGEAGVVAPFRPGIGRLVRRVPGLLVVPVFLAGPERIWPRGQIVPVPMTMDVIVGKPRTYPADEEATAIAERVRSDVLSLAPPIPPPPGPRPAPPLRVAVCAIDAELRTELFLRVVERLGLEERTVGVSSVVFEADDQGMREVIGPIPRAAGRAWLGPLAWLFRTGGRFKGDRFVEMVEQAQLDEALGQGQATRHLVTDGSALVDLLAWAEADFYRGIFDESGLNHLMGYLSGEKKIRPRDWWKFIRNAREVWLVNVFDLAKPPAPDVLVVLRLSIDRVIEKLRQRGEELQPHENEEFLERLQEGYRQVGEILRKRRRVEVLELDPREADFPALAQRVAEVCRTRIEQPKESETQSV